MNAPNKKDVEYSEAIHWWNCLSRARQARIIAANNFQYTGYYDLSEEDLLKVYRTNPEIL